MKCIRNILLIAAVFAGAMTAQAGVFELDSSSRSALGLTVFNTNLAVVRDRRQVVLPTGDIELEFTDVAMTIIAPTVSLDTDRDKGFVAHQQNYRFDLLNRQSLLERFIGRKLKYSRFLLEGGSYEKLLREGILLSINPEIVKFGDVIEVSPEGTISLPYIPDDLKTSPTLVFVGKNARKGEQEIGVRYHVTGVGWDTDYVLTLGKKARLDGWVTIANHSGSDFDVDELRLVAGDVNQVSRAQAPQHEMGRVLMADASAAKAMPSSVAGEYHVYDVPGAVKLLKNDMSQHRLLSADSIATTKTFRLRSQAQRYANQGSQEMSPSVWISFDNSHGNGLYQPLPAGNVRVYEQTGQQETFIGESRLSHTAAGREVSLEIGRAFDLDTKRTQISFKRLGDRSSEVGYRIELSSAKQRATRVFVEEQLQGDWKIVSETRPGNQLDAMTYQFEVTVPAEGEASVEYVTRYSW